MYLHVHANYIIIMCNVGSTQETLEHVLEEGATALNSGGVIALPTDTIYGIAASVNSQQGIERLYEIKGRQRSKPIAICVSDLENMDTYVIVLKMVQLCILYTQLYKFYIY